MCIACFLTFAVILSFVSDRFPRSSVNIPIFSIYLVIQSFLSASTIATQVLVLHLYHTDDTHMSPLRYVIRKGCTFRRPSRAVSPMTPISEGAHKTVEDGHRGAEDMQKDDESISVDEEIEIDKRFKSIAVTMERCFGILIFISNILSLVLFPGTVLS